jgi:2-keto-4-pentenoate hydratase/2-oxohepta-3-ene-1,7-dioic acid hydratase in catechol pathway
MKLATFRAGGEERIGSYLADAGLAVDLHAALSLLPEPPASPLPTTMRGLLALGDDGLDIVLRVAENAARVQAAVPGALSGMAFPEKEIEWLPPVRDPTKIIAIGLNYVGHCREQNAPIPTYPTVFAKFPSSLIGHGGDVVYPRQTQSLDYEAELAFVIGKTAKDVSPHRALDYVAGYMNFNDITARDVQKAERQWVRAKSFDTFAPCGPYLVTRDEVADPQSLGIVCKVNGEVRQSASTSDMVFGVAELVSRLSRGTTLLPGDVVATGTPGGVGIFRDPPTLLRPGDMVEISVEGLGTLRNRVVAEELA